MASKKETTTKTVFQADSSFRGTLTFERPLTILGSFEGDIQGSNALEIGPQAQIKANITVENLTVFGSIEGNVAANDKVDLREGSKLIGNIKAPRLEIDDGVIFEGQSEMSKPNKST